MNERQLEDEVEDVCSHWITLREDTEAERGRNRSHVFGKFTLELSVDTLQDGLRNDDLYWATMSSIHAPSHFSDTIFLRIIA